ncbi:MAG: PDZ domain-containing protein [Thiohalocapsa sp. PB-PSB1]|nr:MAG: PDZ domain-containing protein [Thiohalocapsa sp. PB-PSB1]
MPHHLMGAVRSLCATVMVVHSTANLAASTEVEPRNASNSVSLGCAGREDRLVPTPLETEGTPRNAFNDIFEGFKYWSTTPKTPEHSILIALEAIKRRDWEKYKDLFESASFFDDRPSEHRLSGLFSDLAVVHAYGDDLLAKVSFSALWTPSSVESPEYHGKSLEFCRDIMVVRSSKSRLGFVQFAVVGAYDNIPKTGWYLRSDQVLKLPFDFTRMFEDAESNGLSTRFIDDNPFESDLLRYSDSGESKALVVASGNGRKAWFWSWRHASQKAANTSALKLCESQKSQHGVHTGECQLYAVGTVTVTPELRGKCLPGLELSDRIRHYEGSHQSELSVQVDEASVGLPAYEAGIRAGDLLSAIDGKVVTNASFVTNYFNVGCPDSVEVSYRRPARIPEIHMAPSIREHGCEIGLRTQEVGGLILEDAEIRNGVLVQEVMPGTAAARAGIVPGDIIVELDGSKGVNSWGFSSYIAEKCGTPVSISVLRYADPVTVGVTPLRFR